MKKSIKLRMLTILVGLLVVYAVNAIMSGVTNDQVQLSTTLLADYTVELKSDQLTLEQNQSMLERGALAYIAGQDTVGNTDYGLMVEAIREEADIMMAEEEAFAKKEMNTALLDAYTPYYDDIVAYGNQAENMVVAMEAGKISQVRTTYQSLLSSASKMENSKQAYQETLDTLVAHELKLVHARVMRAAVITIGMGILFLILMVTGIVVVMRTVLRPLDRMQGRMQGMIADLESGEGDLTTRFDYVFPDEVGRIAMGINTFLEQLQLVIQSIRTGSNNINGATRKMDANINNCESTSASIFDGLSEVSANMEEISATLQNIDASTTDILAASKEIRDGADANALQVQQLLDHAKEARANSEHNKASTQVVIEDISARMEESIEKSSSVEKIHELTENILAISEQTNLLALNASIEAARAGDAGKGFAVVATEIQKLSENTKSTANQIQETNEVVLDSVHALVANANELLEYLSSNILVDYDRFVENANENKDGIEGINRVLQKFSDHARSMQELTESLSDGIAEISIASENSVKALVKSTEDMNTLHLSVAEIQTESGNNSATVQSLNAEVEKFKNV